MKRIRKNSLSIVMLLLLSTSIYAKQCDMKDDDIYWVNPSSNKLEKIDVVGFSKCMEQKEDSRYCQPQHKPSDCNINSWRKLAKMGVPKCVNLKPLPTMPGIVTHINGKEL